MFLFSSCLKNFDPQTAYHIFLSIKSFPLTYKQVPEFHILNIKQKQDPNTFPMCLQKVIPPENASVPLLLLIAWLCKGLVWSWHLHSPFSFSHKPSQIICLCPQFHPNSSCQDTCNFLVSKPSGFFFFLFPTWSFSRFLHTVSSSWSIYLGFHDITHFDLSPNFLGAPFLPPRLDISKLKSH